MLCYVLVDIDYTYATTIYIYIKNNVYNTLVRESDLSKLHIYIYTHYIHIFIIYLCVIHTPQIRTSEAHSWRPFHLLDLVHASEAAQAEPERGPKSLGKWGKNGEIPGKIEGENGGNVVENELKNLEIIEQFYGECELYEL